jgi:hypothetical protein
VQGRFDEQRGIRYLSVRNDSGGEIPAHAAMRITGLDTDGLYLVDKPDADGLVASIIFNGPTAIPATFLNDRGYSAPGEGAGTWDFPLLALADPDETAPAVDEEWGTKINQWHLAPNETGFKVVGTVLTTTAGHYSQIVRQSAEAEQPDENCAPGCGWVAGLITDDCLSGSIVSAGGRCETDTDTAWSSEFAWNGTDEVWDAADPLEISGVEYDAHFLRDHDPDGDDPSVGGDPQLYLTRTDASGTTKFWATLDCCGEDYAIFAIAGGVCTGDTTCGESSPRSNIVRIRVDYQQCASAGESGWNGAGWYCVTEETGTTATSEGPNHGDSATSTATAMVNVREWVTPENATATDTVVTTATHSGAGGMVAELTHTLDVVDFDFSTLTGEFTGLTVTIRKYRGTGSAMGGGVDVFDQSVKLIVDGSAASTNKADTVTTWPDTLSDTTYTWSAAELATDGLTLSLLKQANFGVRIVANLTVATATCSIDSVTVEAEAESEPCDAGSCQYLAEDPGVCDEAWLEYFRICSGPYPTQALCSTLCALPDPDDDPPIEVEAPCQQRDFAGATAIVSNAYGACAHYDGHAMDLTSSGTDAATWVLTIGSAVAGLTLNCTDNLYDIPDLGAGPITGLCDAVAKIGTLVDVRIVFFNADPFVLVVDAEFDFTADPTCDGTEATGGYRATITIP